MQGLVWVVLLLSVFAMRLEPGHWAMIGGVVVLILVHEFGHWIVARTLGINVPVFSIGFGSPRIVLGKVWGTEVQVTPWLVGGYVKVDPSDEELADRPIWQRGSVIVAGVAMNYLIAIVLMFSLFISFGERKLELSNVQIQSLSSSIDAARLAGLKTGEKIVIIENVHVNSPEDVRKQIEKGLPGREISMLVQREGVPVRVAVTPQNGQIGVVLKSDAKESFRKLEPPAALLAAVGQTADLTKQMLHGLGVLLHIVTPREVGGDAEVRGIISIVQLGAAAFEASSYSFCMMLAIISINLAVLNLLPIPALDGGHLLFLAIEAVRGKPVSREMQAVINTAFMLILIGVLALGIYNDILDPLIIGR